MLIGKNCLSKAAEYRKPSLRKKHVFRFLRMLQLQSPTLTKGPIPIVTCHPRPSLP